MSSSDFDWYDDDEGCVAIKHQAAVAVYTNVCDEVVIRQQDQYGDEDDLILVTKDNVLKLATEMLAVAGIQAKIVLAETANPPEPLLLPKAAPLSSAERQRRYRNRKRNAAGDGEHHERNGDGDAERHDQCGKGR